MRALSEAMRMWHARASSKSATKGKSIHRCNDRFCTAFDAVEKQILSCLSERFSLLPVEICKFFDVCTGDESLVSTSSEHNDLHLRIGLCNVHCFCQFPDYRSIQRIERLWAFDGYREDAIRFVLENQRVGHGVVGRFWITNYETTALCEDQNYSVVNGIFPGRLANNSRV
jgi:hypothetical protein